MAWRGTVSRSLLYSARSSVGRSLPRARPPTIAAPRLPRRHRPAFAPTRSFGELGCTQSLLPLHSMVAAARLTSNLSVDFRAWRELSQGSLGSLGGLLLRFLLAFPDCRKKLGLTLIGTGDKDG